MNYETSHRCDNCKEEIYSNEKIYCEGCFIELEEKVSALKKENGRLKIESKELRKKQGEDETRTVKEKDKGTTILEKSSMTLETIVQMFRQKVCKEINLSSEGTNRYIVFTPFMFDDGDHLPILLKQENEQWYLSDEGHIFMRINYNKINIEKGLKFEIMNTILCFYKIKNIEGELRAYVENDNYGDTLYNFIQGLTKIIEYLQK